MKLLGNQSRPGWVADWPSFLWKWEWTWWRFSSDKMQNKHKKIRDATAQPIGTPSWTMTPGDVGTLQYVKIVARLAMISATHVKHMCYTCTSLLCLHVWLSVYLLVCCQMPAGSNTHLNTFPIVPNYTILWPSLSNIQCVDCDLSFFLFWWLMMKRSPRNSKFSTTPSDSTSCWAIIFKNIILGAAKH